MRLTLTKHRGAALPKDVAQRCLGRGERALAHASTADGRWLVGTRDRLHIVGPRERSTSLAWEDVQRADWDKEAGTLRLERVVEYGEPVDAEEFALTDPRALLTLLRERVTASIVLQRRVEVEGRRGFSVIGRRPPAGTGEVRWAFEFDPGVDPADETVWAAAQAGLRDARESLGL